MSTTYLELTNKVLRLLNEVELTSSNFDAARGVHATVKDAINHTVNHIQSEEYYWPFNFVKDQSTTLTTGTSFYDFELDYKIADWDSFYIYNDGTLNTSTKILKVINDDQYHKYLKRQDFDNTTNGTGLPDFVFAYGNNQFGVSPIPDKDYVLKYDYYVVPTPLVNHDDTTTIPPQFDYVIILGAMWYGNLFKSDEGGADRVEKNFINALERMRSILINKREDVVSTVINHGGQYTRSMDRGSS